MPFIRLAKTRPNETIVLANSLYKSGAHRDKVDARVMADPRMQEAPPDMPFDPKRTACGGFKTIVAA